MRLRLLQVLPIVLRNTIVLLLHQEQIDTFRLFELDDRHLAPKDIRTCMG